MLNNVFNSRYIFLRVSLWLFRVACKRGNTVKSLSHVCRAVQAYRLIVPDFVNEQLHYLESLPFSSFFILLHPFSSFFILFHPFSSFFILFLLHIGHASVVMAVLVLSWRIAGFLLQAEYRSLRAAVSSNCLFLIRNVHLRQAGWNWS